MLRIPSEPKSNLIFMFKYLIHLELIEYGVRWRVTFSFFSYWIANYPTMIIGLGFGVCWFEVSSLS